MKLVDTFTITSSEYRPCYVDGQKALFHKWIEKESYIIKFEGIVSYEDRIKIFEEYKQHGFLPAMCDLQKITELKAIVEFEDGRVSEVKPEDICFADNKVSDYIFDKDDKTEK